MKRYNEAFAAVRVTVNVTFITSLLSETRRSLAKC